MFLFATFFVVQAQENEQAGLTYVGESNEKFTMPSLASRSNLEQPVFSAKPPQDGRSAKVEAIPEKDPQTTNDYFAENPHPLTGKYPTRDALFDFVVGNNVGSPSDPAIAIGPDHAFIVYNTGFMIYDKDGNIVQGPTSPAAIFNSGGCCDLTASYDNLAQRWVISYLGNGVLVAVSSDSNPVTSTWDVYTLPQVNDYNKLSVWRDGYYITDNGARDVWALDRDAVLAGDPTAGIQGFTIPGVQGQGFTSAQVLNITNDDHPTTGGAPLIFMRDDGFGGVTEDAINIWTVNVDFDTPGNSNVPAPEVFTNIEPFINVFDGGNFANLTQPGGTGGTIDALQSTIMNQAQFRKFPTYNSAIFNFVVDLEASNSIERAGIRWYEFRQTVDGGPWSIAQEGTYAAPDGRHAWMGSMAMDSQGNIGMGYTTMAGPDTPNPTDWRVSAAYTGRFATDAPGTMNIEEVVFGQSTGNIPGDRFGDYAKLDVDPTNDDEFWFITEYRFTNHVAVFKIAPDAALDAAVIDISQPEDGALGMTESVTVTVRNLGTDVISNVPVSFTVDGGAAIQEVVAGPIAPSTNIDYTFTATANLGVQGTTYTICARTSLAGDEIPENDEFCKDVSHLNAIDVGVSAITAPTSGQLGMTEQVTITVENFGSTNQTSIPVFYNINGGADVTATYTGDLAQGESDTFTFTDTEDLSVIGDYTIVAGTMLANDADASNDTTEVVVSSTVCQPISNCAEFGDGVTIIELADQDIATNCGTDPAGYSNDTDIVFNFVLNDNPFDGVVQLGWQNSNYAIWIDFNDNNAFEASELIAEGVGGAADTDVNFVVDFGSISDMTTGMHTMRVRGGDENNGDGDVSDPCENLEFGRTNDYTANITGELGIDDATFSEAEFVITSADNKMFDLQFNTTTYTEKLDVNVYNTLGQNLAFYTLENNGAGYTKTINMSYAAAGVYFVRIGENDLNKVQRIIVK